MLYILHQEHMSTHALIIFCYLALISEYSAGLSNNSLLSGCGLPQWLQLCAHLCVCTCYKMNYTAHKLRNRNTQLFYNHLGEDINMKTKFFQTNSFSLTYISHNNVLYTPLIMLPFPLYILRWDAQHYDD